MTDRVSKHILVVNDTEEILDLFRDILEGMGHRMTAWSFSSGRPCQGDRDSAGPELILDLMIGPTGFQGWALLQKIRMSPPTEEIPIIVCTAATNWVREQEGWLAANGVKVVLKPFKVAHLEHAVEQTLALRPVTASGEMREDGDSRAAVRDDVDRARPLRWHRKRSLGGLVRGRPAGGFQIEVVRVTYRIERRRRDSPTMEAFQTRARSILDDLSCRHEHVGPFTPPWRRPVVNWTPSEAEGT